MIYLESKIHDPAYNLALEQFVFDALDPEQEYFMLWQNDNTIVVGKHQNTVAEINSAYVREHGIQVVRRLSGGGAVYHDLGNINFTFIAKAGNIETFDFSTFCIPVVKALEQVGVKAELTGRNDIAIDGKKFSGNSQYVRRGRVMHHGTIMYDSNLSVVSAALTPPKDKFESKGFKSVVSRVTNVRPYVKKDMDTLTFLCTLRDCMDQEYHLTSYVLSREQEEKVRTIQKERYATWEWTYGQSPAYTHLKERYVPNCGHIQLYMTVEQGVLQKLSIHGDYFGNKDTRKLGERLTGCPMEEQMLLNRLKKVFLPAYIQNLTVEQLVSLILQ